MAAPKDESKAKSARRPPLEDAARRPLEPPIGKDERKALARRVRELLLAAPRSVGQVGEALEIEPEVVVIALRELRAQKQGRLRSTITLGHVSWWWEPPAEVAKAPAQGKKDQKRKKGKAGKKGK
jgi:hypothetical protein